MRDQAHRNIEKMKIKDSQLYNQKKNMKNPSYVIGDKVWVYIPVVKQGQSRKFTPKWYGPFTVEEILLPVNFRLSNPHGKHIHDVIHAQRLKPYTDPLLRPTLIPVENEINFEPLQKVQDNSSNEVVSAENIELLQSQDLVDSDGNSLLDEPDPIPSYTEKHHKVVANTPAIVQNADDGVEQILATEARWDHGLLKTFYLVKWNGMEEQSWVSAEDLTAPIQIRQFLEKEQKQQQEKLSQESCELGSTPPIYDKTEKRKVRPVRKYNDMTINRKGVNSYRIRK